MRSSLAVFAATLSIFAAPGRAADPHQPTSKWIVSFADAQCVATRNYGSEAEPLYLVLKAPPLGGVLQIGIVRKGKMSTANQVDGEILFDANPPIRTNLLEFGAKELGQRALLVNLPLPELAPMRQASVIRIRARMDNAPSIGTRISAGTSRTDEQFALAQMGSLLKVMDKCAVDLRRVWNITGVDQPSPNLKAPPSSDLSGVFSSEDYPAIALNKDYQGRVGLALLIDEAGRLADCTVIETSGVASLDAQSCIIIKQRARFKPAIGLDGKPAKGGYTARISWKIEG